MNVEDARTMTDDALRRLADALNKGKSEPLVEFLTALARFHRYSWGNLALILAQRPDATRVAGFHTWRSLGRAVRKGEKGIAILAPVSKRIAADEEPRENASATDREPGRRVVWFKVAWVFDVAQTDGQPLPAIRSAEGDAGANLARLRSLVLRKGIRLVYGGIEGGALGVSSGGLIRIREGLDPAEEFCTLAHEFAHELLHQRRAGAADGDTSGGAVTPAGDPSPSGHGCNAERPPHAVRETEAEAVAFVVATAVGIDSLGASSDYVQLHRGDATLLAKSLERVQRVSAAILEELLDEGHAERIAS